LLIIALGAPHMNKIINFEGIPGVGKTTALNYLKTCCIEAGLKCLSINDLLFYEGDRVGKKIFNIMQDNNDVFMRLDYPYIEAFLSQAIRYNIVYETIHNFDEYDVVFEDRGLDTYFSYMLARINSEHKKDYVETINWLEKLNKYCQVEYTCSILLMDELDECKRRYELKNEKPFSANDWVFLSEVKNAYMFLHEKYNRITLLDVNGMDKEQVGIEVLKTLSPLLDLEGHKFGM